MNRPYLSLLDTYLNNENEYLAIKYKFNDVLHVDASGVTVFGKVNGVESSKITSIDKYVVNVLPTPPSSTRVMFLTTTNKWYYFDSTSNTWKELEFDVLTKQVAKLDNSGNYTGAIDIDQVNTLRAALTDISMQTQNLDSSGTYTGRINTNQIDGAASINLVSVDPNIIVTDVSGTKQLDLNDQITCTTLNASTMNAKQVNLSETAYNTPTKIVLANGNGQQSKVELSVLKEVGEGDQILGPSLNFTANNFTFNQLLNNGVRQVAAFKQEGNANKTYFRATLNSLDIYNLRLGMALASIQNKQEITIQGFLNGVSTIKRYYDLDVDGPGANYLEIGYYPSLTPAVWTWLRDYGCLIIEIIPNEDQGLGNVSFVVPSFKTPRFLGQSGDFSYIRIEVQDWKQVPLYETYTSRIGVEELSTSYTVKLISDKEVLNSPVVQGDLLLPTRGRSLRMVDANDQQYNPLANIDETSKYTGPIEISQVNGLQAALNNTTSSAHQHVITDVSGLQVALDSKANSIHTHSITDVSGLTTALSGKANTSHTHTISQITDLQTTLDSKLDANGGTVTNLLAKTSRLNSDGTLTWTNVSGKPPFFTTSRIRSLPSEPGTGIGGDVYYNSSDYKVYVYKGTPLSWSVLGDPVDLTTLNDKTTNLTSTGTLPYTAVTGVPTNVSQFTNDSGYLTNSSLSTLDNKTQNLTSTGTLPWSAITGAPSSTNQIQSDWNQTTTTALDYIKNKPTIPDTTNFSQVGHQHEMTDVSGLTTALVDLNTSILTHNHDASYSAIGHNHNGVYSLVSHTHDASYASITHNHDASYSAIGHTHAYSSLTGIPTSFQADRIVTAAANPTGTTQGQIYFKTTDNTLWTYNGTTWQQVQGGSATSVAWDSITGKPTTFAPSAHTHAIADVTNLQTTLDGKASSTHNHDTTYAPISHTHTIANVTGLQTALDGKASSSHTHAMSNITGLETALGDKVNFATFNLVTNNKADLNHTHEYSSLTGIPSAFTANKLQIANTAPSGVQGDIYYNSSTNKVFAHNGTTWVDLQTTSVPSWVSTSQSSVLLQNFGGSISQSQINLQTSTAPAYNGTSDIGDIWFHTLENRLTVRDNTGIARAIAYEPPSAITPLTPSSYDMEVRVRTYDPNIKDVAIDIHFNRDFTEDPLTRYSFFFVNVAFYDAYLDRYGIAPGNSSGNLFGDSFNTASYIWLQELYPRAFVAYDVNPDAQLNFGTNTGRNFVYGSMTPLVNWEQQSYRLETPTKTGYNTRVILPIHERNPAARASTYVGPTIEGILNGFVIVLKHNGQQPVKASKVKELTIDVTTNRKSIKTAYGASFISQAINAAQTFPANWYTLVINKFYENYNKITLAGDMTYYSSLISAAMTEWGVIQNAAIIQPPTAINLPSGDFQIPVNTSIARILSVTGQSVAIPVMGNNQFGYSVFERMYLSRFNDTTQRQGSFCVRLTDLNNRCVFLPTNEDQGLVIYEFNYQAPQYSSVQFNTNANVPRYRYAIAGTTPTNRSENTYALDANMTWQPMGFPLTPVLAYKRVKVTSNETMDFLPYNYTTDIERMWGTPTSFYQFSPQTKIFEYYGSSYTSPLFRLFQSSVLYMKYGSTSLSGISNTFITKPGTDADSSISNSLHRWWTDLVYANRSQFDSLSTVFNERADGSFVVTGVRYNRFFFKPNTPATFEPLITSAQLNILLGQIF